MSATDDKRRKGLYDLELAGLAIAALLILWLSTSVGMAATLLASLIAFAGFIFNSRPRPESD